MPSACMCMYVLVVVVYVSLLQGQLAANDKLEVERQNAKNAVEEYVYEIRDKLSMDYEDYITEQV